MFRAYQFPLSSELIAKKLKSWAHSFPKLRTSWEDAAAENLSSNCSKGQRVCIVVKLRIKLGSILFAGSSSHSNIYKACWIPLCVDYVGGSMKCMCGISMIKFSLLCGYNLKKTLDQGYDCVELIWCIIYPASKSGCTATANTLSFHQNSSYLCILISVM